MTKDLIISPYYNKQKIMSIKLIELVNSVEALNKLSEAKLPAKVSFSLGKFLKEITTDIETYNKVRNEKVLEYGRPILDADGKATDKVSFSDVDGSTELNENGKKFVEEMQEIENREIEISIPSISINDLGDHAIEPKYLLTLTWLLKE